MIILPEVILGRTLKARISNRVYFGLGYWYLATASARSDLHTVVHDIFPDYLSGRVNNNWGKHVEPLRVPARAHLYDVSFCTVNCSIGLVEFTIMGAEELTLM